MLAKRIIVALDIKQGRVVKGVKFKQIRDAGDPVQLAKRYEKEGVDELVFLDITASHENRSIIIDLVKQVARELYIPFTVGGGIKTTEEMRKIVKSGADKVFINTAAVDNPRLVEKGARLIGTSNLVVAVDAKWNGEYWEIYTHGGRKPRGKDVLDWCQKVEQLGAGEILLTSMDTDGTKDGFDLPLTRQVTRRVNIPVIASGGAGSPRDFYRAFQCGADAALAASIFHYNEFKVLELKRKLRERGIHVRIK